PNARRRQAGNDGDWVDKTLVEHAEENVGGKDRRQNQHSLSLERFLEYRGRPLEAGGDRGRQAGLTLDLLDRIHRLPERKARRQVERDGDRGLVAQIGRASCRERG